MTWRGKPSTRQGRTRAAGLSGWEEQRRSRRVLERDDHACYFRGPDCIGVATQVDHITPTYKGGAVTEDNLAAICEPCHRAKSRREAAESRRPRPSIYRE